jgi:hypothetical protein
MYQKRAIDGTTGAWSNGRSEQAMDQGASEGWGINRISD